MYKDLKDKVAVVTGASGGLGSAIAKRLAGEGVRVIVNYHSDRLGAQEVVADVNSIRGHAVAVQADVSTEEGISELRQAALKHFNRLDIWINNAGYENRTPTHQLSLAEWQGVMSVDLNGVFLGTRCALNHFLDQKIQGCIINMSSVHEVIPWPTFAHYAASKSGVGMFTKTVALEYASRGIRVNAIGPGAINTPINAEKFADPALLEQTVSMVPMKKIGDPEDVAAAAAWLASEESKYVTGITLFVDGGMTLYPSFEKGDG